MAAPPEASLVYRQISCVGKAGLGAFKLSKDQLGWKSTEAGAPDSTVAFVGKDVSTAQWQNSCGRGRGLLKLSFRGGAGVSRFAGFKKEDLKPLQQHLQSCFGVSLVEQPVASEGWSWGEWELQGEQDLQVVMNGKVAFEVADLSQVQLQGKGELNIEFQEDNLRAPEDEVLHGMRLFVPGVNGAASAETLRDELQKRSGLSAVGDVIMRFSDVVVVQPRGKHDLEFLPKVLKMHGKTQNYSIKYQSIARLFLLEMPSTGAVSIVVGLDQPLRQGTQMHNFLMFNFQKEVTAAVSKAMADRCKMQISPGEEHPVYSAVGKLLKELSGKSVVASSSEFTEANPQKQACVSCSHKAQPGHLFALKKSLLFVPKPVLWVRYDDIEGVEFNKNLMRRNSFDLNFHLKSKQHVEFVNLDAAVYQSVYDFLEKSGLTILNIKDAQQPAQSAAARRSVRDPGTAPASADRKASAGSAAPAAEGDDEEEDEDFEDEGSSAGDGEEADDSEESFEADTEPLVKRSRRG